MFRCFQNPDMFIHGHPLKNDKYHVLVEYHMWNNMNMERECVFISNILGQDQHTYRI